MMRKVSRDRLRNLIEEEMDSSSIDKNSHSRVLREKFLDTVRGAFTGANKLVDAAYKKIEDNESMLDSMYDDYVVQRNKPEAAVRAHIVTFRKDFDALFKGVGIAEEQKFEVEKLLVPKLVGLMKEIDKTRAQRTYKEGKRMARISRDRLRSMIKEELTVLTVDPAALSGALGASDPDQLLLEKMTGLLGCLRAANLWFHAAHNLAKGPGFIGDHKELYGEIYGQLNDDYDTAAEKGISLTGDETVACPQVVTVHAAEKLMEYPSPAGMGAEQIVACACEMMQGLNEKVTELFDTLESAGVLSLGLNDFLAATANQYETYIYLLQQRAKG